MPNHTEVPSLLEVFHPDAALRDLPDPDQPAWFGEIPAVSVAMLLGAVRVENSEGFWERHNLCDEILVIRAGHATFTGRRDGETSTVEVRAGDVLRIRPGVAHNAVIHEPLEVVFLTPADGNEAWTEGPDAHRRHN
jgi:mannose-6-phosphate isomerase-like protein (cupin superfamily)